MENLTIEQVAENIWSFPVVLPQNPLKWLNCYVIKGLPGERNLLIDTGFRRPECRLALEEGMRQLDIDPEETDIFLTHLHSDHTGNAPVLQEMGSRILISGIDLDILHSESWSRRKKRVLAEGMPEDVLKDVFEHNPAVLYAPPYFDAVRLMEGDTLDYGGYRLECLLTPGHTPGHMCLYAKEQRLMFLGDHVLFDITPNICNWEELEDALGAYLDSLRAIMQYDVQTALPGHRNCGEITLQARCETLLRHHERRLAEAEQVVRMNPGIQAYDTAGKMTWKIQSRNWEEFPPGQKWFAVGETLAHLDYLTLRGKVERYTDAEGKIHYRA